MWYIGLSNWNTYTAYKCVHRHFWMKNAFGDVSGVTPFNLFDSYHTTTTFMQPLKLKFGMQACFNPTRTTRTGLRKTNSELGNRCSWLISTTLEEIWRRIKIWLVDPSPTKKQTHKNAVLALSLHSDYCSLICIFFIFGGKLLLQQRSLGNLF